MDRYLVKYTVNFSDHNIAVEEEMEVETDDPEIARAYIRSLFETDESNIVEIPEFIYIKGTGYGKTDLFIDSVHLQYSWYLSLLRSSSNKKIHLWHNSQTWSHKSKSSYLIFYTLLDVSDLLARVPNSEVRGSHNLALLTY